MLINVKMPTIVLTKINSTRYCLPVYVNNPQALAGGLSRIQMDNNGLAILKFRQACAARLCKVRR